MIRVNGRFRTALIAGCAVIALNGAIVTNQSDAQESTRQYSIDSQDLGDALRTFAIASGKDVVFDPALVKGKSAHGVTGQLLDEDALRQLLAGSGLVFERTATGGFAIHAGKVTGEIGGSGHDDSAVASSVNNVFGVDEVVVTGTASKIDKFTAPYSISTLKEEAVLDKAPRSLADMLRGQPGITVENSGGEGGDENIVIRGLPYAGFRLIDVLQDGLPFYESNYERFLNIDEVFRVDLMTQRAEVERGGTAPIYSNNASGGVVNLVTRHGTETFEGAGEIEGGSNALVKVSGYESGPITDQLLFAFGGSYRRDNGLRDQNFSPADDGGQVQFGATYNFDRGKIFADVKYLNDKSAIYTDIPLTNPITGASLSGLINPNSGTLTSSAFENVQLRTLNGTPTGAFIARNLSNGVHPEVTTATLGGDYDLGDGWTATDRARYIQGKVSLDGIFNAATPTSASTFLAGYLPQAKAAFAGTTSLGYTLVGTGATFNPAATAGLVMANNYDAITTEIKDTMNDVRIEKTLQLGETVQNKFTAGFYSSFYDYGHQEYENSILEDVKNNPDGLNIVALGAGGNVLGSVTENGFLSYGSGSANGALHGTSLAPYAADTLFLTPSWQIDGGVRFESRQQSGTQGVLGTLNVNPTGPLAARTVQGVVSYTPHSEDLHGTSYSFGSAYDIDADLNGFVRYTHAYSFPQFTTIITGALLPNGQPVPVSTVNQAEGGVKFKSSTFQAAVTGFYSHFNQLSASTQVAAANGAITTSNIVLDSTSIGVEGEADWRPFRFFDLSGTVTIQNPKIDSIQTLTGPSAQSSLNDTIPRVPTYSFSLEPAYIFDFDGLSGRAFADIYTVGKRFQDDSNLSVLPGYTTLDLGITANPTDRVELRLLVTNVTNSAGLTEGNARASALGTGTVGDATVGRPIFGRGYTASLLYRW